MINIHEKIKASRSAILSGEAGKNISVLEKEWAKYKYIILAKNPNGYKAIRAMLKDKSAFPAEEFFAVVDSSLLLPENVGYEINAASHVAGYFRGVASNEEKAEILALIASYGKRNVSLHDVKQAMLSLSEKYNLSYLLDGYYFYL